MADIIANRGCDGYCNGYIQDTLNGKNLFLPTQLTT
jgi:hypothetical protein